MCTPVYSVQFVQDALAPMNVEFIIFRRMEDPVLFLRLTGAFAERPLNNVGVARSTPGF